MSNHTQGPWMINFDPDDDDWPLEIVTSDRDHRVAFPATNGNPADAYLIAAAPDMLAALDAHAAWSLAEENGSGVTWEGRSELANYANWLTRKARALAAGKTFEEPYKGVPHMIVWPQAEIQRASEDIAADLVRMMLAEERQS